jgi:hypothetical protein
MRQTLLVALLSSILASCAADAPDAPPDAVPANGPRSDDADATEAQKDDDDVAPGAVLAGVDLDPTDELDVEGPVPTVRPSAVMPERAAQKLTFGEGADDYGSDWEWHSCGKYHYQAKVSWYRWGKEIRYAEVIVWQYNGKGEWSGGLDYRLQARTTTGNHQVWWSTGKRSTKSFVASRFYGSFPNYMFHKEEKPYIRFEVGKDGDGKANCAFRVYPLEPG